MARTALTVSRNALTAARSANGVPRSPLVQNRGAKVLTLAAGNFALTGPSVSLNWSGASGPASLVATAIAPLEVRLSWSHGGAPADTRYQIERGDGAGGWLRVGTAWAGYPRFWDHSRTPSTSYSYRVRAVNSLGTSSYTNTASATTVAATGSLEFNGPLADWKNLKTDYGAVGNGTPGSGGADDTAALQTALTALEAHSGFHTLFVPTGTYRLTSTVQTIRTTGDTGQGIQIVGEDPANTIFLWDGPIDVQMLLLDMSQSRISRITFDGQNVANVTALEFDYTFSTLNEVSDCVFRDVPYGLQLGAGSGGQAEIMILRNHFLRCSQRAISTSNYNSLDVWAWYCHFEDCARDLFNGAGGVYAYHCFFDGSLITGVGTNNQEFFSFVNNTSIGAARFLDMAPGSPLVATGNRIIDFTGSRAMSFSEAWPFHITDNFIKGTTAPFIGRASAEHLYAGNIYNVAGAISDNGSHREFDEEVIAGSAIDSNPPTLPGTPTTVSRTVFDVAAGASAATIQAAIDNAEAAGNRSIVNLRGSSDIATTLNIHANSDIQLVGAGLLTGTVLTWTGAAGGTLLHIQGPTQCVVRDFSINARDNGHGIVITNVDQANAQVHGSQLYLNGVSGTTGMLVDGVENADVTMLCFQGGGCGEWVRVNGGTNQAAGTLTEGQVAIFCGAASTSDTAYRVENGGRLVVKTIFHEASGVQPTAINMTGHGSLAVAGSRFSYQMQTANPLFKINGAQGDLVIAGCKLQPVQAPGGTTPEKAQVSLSGNGSQERVLITTTHFVPVATETGTADDVWHDTSSPAATAGFTLNYWAEPNYSTLANRGTVTDAHMRTMLVPLRAARIPLPRVPATGITSVVLHRLMVEASSGRVSLTITA